MNISISTMRNGEQKVTSTLLNRKIAILVDLEHRLSFSCGLRSLKRPRHRYNRYLSSDQEFSWSNGFLSLNQIAPWPLTRTYFSREMESPSLIWTFRVIAAFQATSMSIAGIHQQNTSFSNRYSRLLGGYQDHHLFGNRTGEKRNESIHISCPSLIKTAPSITKPALLHFLLGSSKWRAQELQPTWYSQFSPLGVSIPQILMT